ncbi:hypothetical protein [Enterococcus sp. AZ135]|uniref:hypothetical protein n=2 Tax=Enterococcus TaxID=1350 RepID=UPI003F688F50
MMTRMNISAIRKTIPRISSSTPISKWAFVFLTNINSTANTNMMAENIMNIMEDKAITPYQLDFWVTIDITFSIITFNCVPLIVFMLIMLVRIKKRYRKEHRVKKISGKRIAFLPTFSNGWFALNAWAPYNMYKGIDSFTF